MMLSLAMACRSRGAPVSDCRPAPHVEKNEPMTMTQGVGHARVPTTRFPFTESPNLQEDKIHVEYLEYRGEQRNWFCHHNKPHKHKHKHTDSRCLTDLSLRTTPSMQAPNRTTLVRSGRGAQGNNRPIT